MLLKFTEVTSANQCSTYLDPQNVNRPSFPEAVFMTSRFRDMIASSEWKYSETKGYTISRESLIEILGQNHGKISGIRIYFGDKEEAGKRLLELIVIGLDENGDDYDIPTGIGGSSAAIFADTRPCPIHCGKENVLNTKS